MDNNRIVTDEALHQASRAFFADRANRVAEHAVTAKGIRAVARVPEAAARNTTTFDVEVKQGDRTDQKRSGRCWMFASLNTMRTRVMKKYGLKNFELSQAYPLFWDKLEKSNWFLENIIDTADESRDGRLVQFLLTDPVGDGGQWDMFRALVKKYGVVPKEAMPETACSSNTREMDTYLTRYLRKCAKDLRDAHEAGKTDDQLRQMKGQYLENVYKLLVMCLGEPPKTFQVRLRGAGAEPGAAPADSSVAASAAEPSAAGQGADASEGADAESAADADPACDTPDADNKLVLAGTFTPQQFFEQVVDMPIDDYVSIISAPTADKPFGKTYTVSRLGNVVEAGGVRYLNLPPADLKAAAIKQLKDDLPVWFGCDVGQSYIQDEGLMDLDSLDVDTLFGFDVEAGFDKAARLDFGESLMTHAMVLEGVNFDETGAPTLWKVENSWGKDHGKNGFDSIADSWFDEYVYQVVVNKKYLTEDQREAYESIEPIVLAPWDPMGALA